MQKNILLAAAGLVIIAGIIFWAFWAHPPVDEALREQFSWTLLDLGVDPQSRAPRTQVLLRVAGVDIPLGIYEGSCFDIKGSRFKYLPDEVAGAVCSWGGKGKEVGVFSEKGNLVIKLGDVEKADTAPVRGGFKPLTSTSSPSL